MKEMLNFENDLAGKRVFITGHTGFTGGWLTCWLHRIGCSVVGLALPPETNPNLFKAGKISDFLESHFVDIRDASAVRGLIAEAAPEIVFHLAAQPLVRRSYASPLETFATNAMGTANVLEGARSVPSVKAFIAVTTDKVYANREWVWPFRERDALGGNDPYSASKACAELITNCYARTMAGLGNGMHIASVRGGNIIGGGDWSQDRIVPDFYRAVDSGRVLEIRNPEATRPWQHVLSACQGYLMVAASLIRNEIGCTEMVSPSAWNIGPCGGRAVTVRNLLSVLAKHWDTPQIVFTPSDLPETQNLALDTSKAERLLGFRSPWTTDETLRRTAIWYSRYRDDPACARDITLEQLTDYRTALAAEYENNA